MDDNRSVRCSVRFKVGRDSVRCEAKAAYLALRLDAMRPVCAEHAWLDAQRAEPFVVEPIESAGR